MVRILKVIFVILLLITTGETIYYLYTLRSKPSNNNSITPTVSVPQSGEITQVIKELIPSNTEQHNTVTPANNVLPTINPNSDFKEMVKQHVLLSTVTTDIFKSEILNIDTNSGIINNFNYKVKLTIKVGPANSYDFYLTDDGFKRLRVVKISNKKEIPIDLTDLKIGDKILIERKIDEYKEIGFNILDFKITKETENE